MENLHKIGGSNQRLFAARSLLWLGKVNETIDLFNDCELDQVRKFCAYLEKHHHRIVNYYYLQAEQVCATAEDGAQASVLARLSLRLNRSIDELNSLGHSGNLKIFLKF
jgi:hypothetical protein